MDGAAGMTTERDGSSRGRLMHRIGEDPPALGRPAMILLVLLFVTGFLISVVAPNAKYELAMMFH